MTAAASSSSQPNPLSRLARLGANFGLKYWSQAGPSRQTGRYTDANESEWYIPYNGTYEQPRDAEMGRVGNRDSWSAGGEHACDPFERDRSALGPGGTLASSHGHRHGQGTSAHGHATKGYDAEEHERGRQLSPASKYSESQAAFGGGERRSHAFASPTMSPISPRQGPLPTFLDLDTTGVRIGEVPVPVQRAGRSSNSGHGHDSLEYTLAHATPSSAPAVPTRDSTASFWAFGRSASKKGPPINVATGRPSAESRPSTSTRQTILQGPVVMRDRSATIAGQGGEPSTPRALRPRANTAAPPTYFPSSDAHNPSSHRYQYPDNGLKPERATSPYQRHPYATAVSPTGHRQHSGGAQPKVLDSQQRRSPGLNINVPFLSSSKSFASLRRATGNLKTSISTPNLRGEEQHGTRRSGGSSAGSPGAGSASSSGTKWLSAETWCDALLFPRPRFRMRTAHVISPPTSPMGGVPPYSAPAQTQSQPRTLKRSLRSGKSTEDLRKGSQAPSSAPPIVSHPSPESPPAPPPAPTAAPTSTPAQAANGLSHKSLRPPRPKSFAQDDLAIPSPIPSLATVLKQNEEFDRERNEWKAKASRSFGNKRSRSLSRSRVKSKARVANKAAVSESELAFSFDVIAATAFHGNQSLKPSIHFAQSSTTSGPRSGMGTNTTSTGLNTTSTHSRNTSNTSRGGSGTSRSNGHSRKESWSKSVFKSAKHTAISTGLGAFNEDLKPADERVIALDNRLQQDRTKYVNLDPRENVTDAYNGDIVLITAQMSNHLDASLQNTNGPALSPVPSNRSGESTGHSGVGIALSTPTALVDQPFQFTEHPYASVPRQSDDMPRPAEYAGPHPSRMAEFALNESTLSDVSVRHRMPTAPSRSYAESPSQHPFAVAEARSRPTLRVPVRSIPPPAKMFADIGTGFIREVMPDEIQYSPYSAQYSAASSKRNSELGVEEALSVAFRRGGMDGRQVEGQLSGEAEKTDETEDFGSRTGVQELIAPPLLKSAAEYRGTLMSRVDEDSIHGSWQNPPNDDNNGNLVAPIPMSAASYKLNSSPAQISLDSSPMASPRQFKKFDDMEDYSDLFYRPGQQATTASGSGKGGGSGSGSSGHPTPPSEFVRTLSSRDEGGGGSQRPMLARSNSALTNLRRQLSEEYGADVDDRRILGGDTTFNRHVSEVIEVDEDIDDAHALLSQGSSPPGASLPLRLQTTRVESPGPEHVIPEDVESSRASSILERCEVEEGTEIYYHLGEVPALTTPDPVTSSNVQRASSHVSYIDNTPQSQHQSLSPDSYGQRARLSRPSFLQPMSATSTSRGSYMTSTSSASASHMSQLSEFPVPPSQHALTPGTIIQSYFGGTPDATDRRDPLAGSESPERKREELQSRRTTFGPVLLLDDSSDQP